MLGRRCAVKEMLEPPLADADERAALAEAFQQEARLLAALDHPGLPRVHDFFQENGRYYLVMDFIDGDTLEQVATACGGRVEEAMVLAWADAILDVLEYLHARRPPIVFRDLKPDNVMRAANGRIQLIDLGIARLFRPGTMTSPLLRAMGSPGYAAPEQYGSAATDPRTDLYGLGATLYRLLTGAPPPEAAARVAGGPLPRVRSVAAGISPRTDAAIERLLRLTLEERPPGIAATRLLLGAASRAPAPVTAAPAPPTVASPRPVPRRSALSEAAPPLESADFVEGVDDLEPAADSVRLPAWATWSPRRMAIALGAAIVLATATTLFAWQPSAAPLSPPAPAASRADVVVMDLLPSPAPEVSPDAPPEAPTPTPSPLPGEAAGPAAPSPAGPPAAALAHQAAAAGDHARAVPLFEIALAREPSNADLWDGLGLSLDWLERRADALRAFEAAVRIAPESAAYLAHLGRACARCGEIARARGLCEKATALAPRDPAVMNDLAQTLTACGDRPGALRVYGAALALTPRDGVLWGNAGHLYFEMGDGAQARDCYRKALEYAPSQPLVRRRLDALSR